DDVAGSAAYKKILFLDAEGEFRLPLRHLGSPDAEDRPGNRAWVAVRPPPPLDLMEKIGAGPVEHIRFLEVYRMPGVRKHDEGSTRDRALHQDAGLETGVVLVTGHDQGRHFEPGHPVGQIPQGWTPGLHAAHSQGRALRRMPGEMRGKLRPAARVLV